MMALRDQLVKQLTACKNLNSGMQDITADRSKRRLLGDTCKKYNVIWKNKSRPLKEPWMS